MTEQKSRPGCIKVGVELYLLPGQRQEIKDHYNVGSLAHAVTLALQDATGLPIPDKRTRIGKKEILVFDTDDKLIFPDPISRRQVQALLNLKSRQATAHIVKKIKKDGVARRGGYTFRFEKKKENNYVETGTVETDTDCNCCNNDIPGELCAGGDKLRKM